MRELSYGEIRHALSAWMCVKDEEMHPSLDYCELSGLAYEIPDCGDPDDVRIFMCGPIQWGNAHLPGTCGNYRDVDAFVRALRHEGVPYPTILRKLQRLCVSQ